MTGALRIAVLMTCHNRREITLACLRGLAQQDLFREEDLFLVDDGSSDGTGDAVRDLMPSAHVLRGDGSLFWNGGMRLAWDAARRSGREYPFYLWLNDDVTLAPATLVGLVRDADATAPRGAAVIVAAATTEPECDTVTYGGLVRPHPSKPLRLSMLAPRGAPVPVDTFSGNIVLVSAAAEQALGNILPDFEHIYGDLDYGFRAQAAGIPMVLASRSGGTCAANSVAGTSLDPSMSRLARVRIGWREGKKVHARDWRRFVKLHAGGGRLRQLAMRLGPYLRILLDRPNRHGTQVIDSA